MLQLRTSIRDTKLNRRFSSAGAHAVSSVERCGPLNLILSVRQAADHVTRDVFPKRREHSNLNDTFVKLSAVAQSNRPLATGSSSTQTGGRTNSNIRSMRLLSEVNFAELGYGRMAADAVS